MPRTLIIFESASEIPVYLSNGSLNELKEKNITILAIQSDAQAYLKRKGVPFINTTGLFNKGSHQRLILKSDEIIEPFRRILRIRDNLGIKEGYNNTFIFYVRNFLIVYILLLIEVIDNAVNMVKPEKIATFKRDYSTSPESLVQRDEQYLGMIVEKFAIEKGLECEIYRIKRPRYIFFADRIKVISKEILKLILFYPNLYLFNCIAKGKRYILSSSDNYNLEDVIEPFLSTFNNVISVLLYSRYKTKDIRKMFGKDRRWYFLASLPAYISKKKKDDFSKGIVETKQQLRQFFSDNRHILRFKGIDFNDLVLEKIEDSITPLLYNLYGQTYYLNKFIKRTRPALVISQMSREIFYNLGELAGIYDIPSLLISHGSHVPPSNKYEDIEWGDVGLGLMNTHYKYLAVQSPWALEYLKKKPSASIPIITGPLLFTKLQKNGNLSPATKKKIIPKHYHKIIILHAGTPKLSRPYIYETVDEYINNVNSIIKAIDKFEGIHLIVRFRSLRSLQLEDFIELLIKSERYTVHSKGSFSDYLAICDLLVSYSSTTIEEALQNRIPVLLYDPQTKYCHIKDAQTLDPSLKPHIDPCYYVDAEDKLQWGLNWIVENHLKQNIDDSAIWERHLFDEREKVRLTSYFKKIF